MGFIAIVGAGALGGAVAQRLAARGRTAEVRLIDPHGSVARGKALDLLQSSPIDGFATRITAAETTTAAVGADAIVLADTAAEQQEHAGEAALALVRQIVREGTDAPLVCAGALQRDVIAKAVAELHLRRTRIFGSAPLALESALRAMAGLLLDVSGVEIALRVVGIPPGAAVVAWEAATVTGLPLSSQLPPHAIAALNARIAGLWPPGPYALGSAAARVAEAAVHGSRRQFSCFVALERGATRTAVAAMPVELAPGGIRRILEPNLTPQERTLLENAIG